MRGNFKQQVDKAYKIICSRALVDDAELQYLLDTPNSTFYRIRRALLAIYPDVEHEKGYFKLKQPKEPNIQEYWGSLEPQEAHLGEADAKKKG
ncbi:MAG: hypothetical protein QXW32_07125 [Nitrososphaerales archaeon]